MFHCFCRRSNNPYFEYFDLLLQQEVLLKKSDIFKYLYIFKSNYICFCSKKYYYIIIYIFAPAARRSSYNVVGIHRISKISIPVFNYKKNIHRISSDAPLQSLLSPSDVFPSPSSLPIHWRGVGPLWTPTNWFFERFYKIKSNWKSSSLFLVFILSCLLLPDPSLGQMNKMYY